MPLFRWKDTYSVGVEELDEHHRKLFLIFNTLYEKCLEPEGIDDVAGRIDELFEYAEYHLAEEEEYMKQIGYKGREDHIRLHKKFIAKIVKLKRKSYVTSSELTKELIVFLGNWLLHHVMEEDKKYSLKMS